MCMIKSEQRKRTEHRPGWSWCTQRPSTATGPPAFRRSTRQAEECLSAETPANRRGSVVTVATQPPQARSPPLPLGHEENSRRAAVHTRRQNKAGPGQRSTVSRGEGFSLSFSTADAGRSCGPRNPPRTEALWSPEGSHPLLASPRLPGGHSAHACIPQMWSPHPAGPAEAAHPLRS